MTSYGPANIQARKLLLMLCKFIIPLVQSIDSQTIKDADEIPLGDEADAFINQLENFISGAQYGNKDKSLEVTLQDSVDSKEKLEEKTTVIAPRVESQALRETLQEGASPVETEKDQLTQRILNDKSNAQLQASLYILRAHITTYMPIRVLFCEPSGSKLKLSLLDKNGVYHRLASQLASKFYAAGKLDSDEAKKWIHAHAKYAILSHTWNQTPGELTYVDWQKGALDPNDPRSQKLFNFCKAAWDNHGIPYGWVDTVCINKESSSELDESIRSMYKWYFQAAICITYLADTEALSEMADDTWFTRGWTFQELIAPRVIKFYNARWTRLVPSEKNDKRHPLILEAIHRATTLTKDELRHIQDSSISRRMELAAKRQVTREEDTAYSLMGVFDVSIPTAYGEGAEHAFFRLVKEIFDSTKDVSDIFNWAGSQSLNRHITSLFPSKPSAYLARSTDVKLRPWLPIEPFTLTHLGLRTPILLMSVADSVSEADKIGEFHGIVSIRLVNYYLDPSFKYTLLQKRGYNFGKLLDRKIGILNVETHDSDQLGQRIRIPKTCFGLLLDSDQRTNGYYKRISTQDPIVFTLENKSNASGEEDYYVVEKSELRYHGMDLVTLYL